MTDTPNPIQLQKYLSGVDYPASRDDLVKTAEGNGADNRALEALRGMKEDSFDSPTAVSAAISDE